jgi:hypothetical protein
MPRDTQNPAQSSRLSGAAPFDAMLDELLGPRSMPGSGSFRPRVASSFDPTFTAPRADPGSFQGAAAELYGSADDAPLNVSGASLSVEEAVASELSLSDDLQPAALERLRRRFAYRNHPDRVAPALKHQALERMTIANVLIDAALRTARSRAR